MPNKFWKGRQQKIINNNKVQLPNNCDFNKQTNQKKNSSNQEGILITTMQYQLVRISSGWSFFSTNCHFQKHKHMRNNMTLPIIRPVSWIVTFCLGWSKILNKKRYTETKFFIFCWNKCHCKIQNQVFSIFVID